MVLSIIINMEIVILDGHTLNPGDLDFSELAKLGSIKFYDRTSPEQVISRIGNAQIILVNKVIITKQILESCPSIKYIGLCSTGTNVVDLEYTKQHGITVTNVPSYSTTGVSQLVFSYILAFTNKVEEHNQSVHNKDWINCPDFCYWTSNLTELDGKTLGIIGYGSIGKRTASIAHSFGLNVLCVTRTPSKIEKNSFVKPSSLDEVLSLSDFISIHCPLTENTKNLINRDSLSKMKKTAYLINTARGPIVNEKDLALALNEDKIAGFACDVISEEPMKKDNPLLTCKNTIITPHIAWAAKETRERLLKEVTQNLSSYLNGIKRNIV